MFKFNNINIKEVSQFNSVYMPYYLMNTTADIEIIKEFQVVSDVCFPNSLVHFNNDVNLLKLKNTNGLYTCPHRDNIILYVNWFYENVDEIIEKLKSKYTVELPLFYLDYFYSKLASNNILISISKSIYFNKYIQCLYGSLQDTKTDVHVIHNMNEFKTEFDKLYLDELLLYLNKMTEVVSYIRSKNFYGQQTSIYETQKQEFINKVKINEL